MLEVRHNVLFCKISLTLGDNDFKIYRQIIASSYKMGFSHNAVLVVNAPHSIFIRDTRLIAVQDTVASILGRLETDNLLTLSTLFNSTRCRGEVLKLSIPGKPCS